MPPKKKTKLTQSIAHDLDLAVSRTKPKDLLPHRLSDDLLLRAYGLAGPQRDAPGSENLLRSCLNKWTDPSSANGEQGSSKEINGKGKAVERDEDGRGEGAEEREVLVLDSSDGEDKPAGKAVVKKPAAPKSGKAKGKQKDEGQLKPKPCSSGECDKNPKCLNWLGQDKWESDEQALKDFRKASGLPIDPSNDREPDLPVGLQNLGATCYANSFLQVWFRDARFRSAVYSCLPASNGNVENQPIFQLQVLFAFLQSSQQGVYDPSPFISSLRLDTSEQQDAQEFSKLLLQVLDREFKKQGERAEQEGRDGSVAKLVEEHFEGKGKYVTRCEGCGHESERPSTFTELEVNLTKDCKLEERIRVTLKPEDLDGDNQYFCERCDSKQDATRQSTLVSLPPVLHFSLIRFAWNPKDFSRYKSTHAISYPLQLNMGQFLPPDPQTKKRSEVWYNLKGVLMHKGVSAHHGHYVAQVYDETESKWFLFDDETVSPIDDLNAPTVHDEDGEAVKSKKRPSKGFTRDATGAILPKSKDAYMLVYTRRDSDAPSSGSSSSSHTLTAAQVDPPALAQAAVETLDKKYAQEMEEYKAKADGIEGAFNALREQKRSVYKIWDVKGDEEESYLVDKAELRRWMLDGLKKPKSKKELAGEKDKEKEKTDGASSDVEIVAESAKKADTISPPLKEDVEMVNGTSSSDPTLATSDGPPHENGNGDSKSNSPFHTAPTSPSSLPDSSTLTRPSPPAEPLKVTSNSAIVCEHGLLNPKKAEGMKRVSVAGVEALREPGVTIEPELKVPKDLCRECVGGIAAEWLYHQKHPEDIERFDDADNEGGRSVLLSKAWLKDWRKTNPKMHVEGKLDDPSPGEQPYLADVECEHGGLQPDPKRRTPITPAAAKVLKTLFKGWKPSDAGSCVICEARLDRDVGDTEQLKQTHTKEKKLLKSVSDQFQSRLTGNRLPLSDADDPKYVLPREWCRRWSAWTAKAPSGPNQRPGEIDNSSFLCQHGLVCIDLKREAADGKAIQVVGSKEWNYLEKAYDAKPSIMIWQEGRLDAPSSDPEVCEGCLEEHRKNFTTTELYVKTLSEDDFDKDSNRKPPDSSTKSSSPPIEKPYGITKQYGQRTSSRLKEKPNLIYRKSVKTIEMEKDDQVKDLKRKVEEQLKIPIIAQRLFLNYQELQDASVSVAELGLGSGDTLEVFGVDTDNVDLSKLEDAVPRKGKRGRTEGFGGTGLLGYEDVVLDGENGGGGGAMDVDENGAGPSNGNGRAPSSSSSAAAAILMDEDGALMCPICTFANAAGMSQCEMCETPLK